MKKDIIILTVFANAFMLGIVITVDIQSLALLLFAPAFAITAGYLAELHYNPKRKKTK